VQAFFNAFLQYLRTHYFCYMSVLKQLAEYLYLRPKDPNRPKDKWIGYMHGINRISIFIFILCLVLLAIKLIW
jgi:ferritin